ncbi:MAG: hypothetical protein HC889_15830 [Synechococcaceae cyanobacterium SM1_2_3]|nr:hypothetical protein [Synechococcaceae cyanobacterium SM1_2_3]
MRTTLDIDEDVLAAAKELARRQRMSTGRMVSRLLRQGLTGQGMPVSSLDQQNSRIPPASGFHPFPAGRVVTDDEVNALREAEGV